MELLRHQRRELERFASVRRFLAMIGRIGATVGASVLFYPGAGLDFVSCIATGLREAICIDPDYLSKKGGFSAAHLRQIIQSCFDSDARFSVPQPHSLVADFAMGTRRMRLVLIRGRADHVRKCRTFVGERNTIYLAKGTMRASILLPNVSVASLNPRAFALDLRMPYGASLVRRMYKAPVYLERQGYEVLGIFREYRLLPEPHPSAG